MTLQEMVDTYGVPAVADACGCSESYVKRCLTSGLKIHTVKLVNAYKKLSGNK